MPDAFDGRVGEDDLAQLAELIPVETGANQQADPLSGQQPRRCDQRQPDQHRDCRVAVRVVQGMTEAHAHGGDGDADQGGGGGCSRRHLCASGTHKPGTRASLGEMVDQLMHRRCPAGLRGD